MFHWIYNRYISNKKGGKNQMKKQKKLISFPIDMVALIQEFGRENFINTFTGAVVELVRRGLEYTEQNND